MKLIDLKFKALDQATKLGHTLGVWSVTDRYLIGQQSQTQCRVCNRAAFASTIKVHGSNIYGPLFEANCRRGER